MNYIGALVDVANGLINDQMRCLGSATQLKTGRSGGTVNNGWFEKPAISNMILDLGLEKRSRAGLSY